ncbi:hypothetical protein QP415_12200, partial [Pauljensenia sp. UMB3104]|nr:hypothetical protein [Pauljensenia sp. UMB3104]
FRILQNASEQLLLQNEVFEQVFEEFYQSDQAILFKKLSIDQVQLLPFHQFGENKYKLLKRSYEMENVQALHPEDLYDYQQVFLDY